jgi:hypothetical protein
MFGPDAPFGVILSINPVVVIVFVPIFGALFRKVPAFNIILAGALISGSTHLLVAHKPFTFYDTSSEGLMPPRFVHVVSSYRPQLLEHCSVDHRESSRLRIGLSPAFGCEFET